MSSNNPQDPDYNPFDDRLPADSKYPRPAFSIGDTVYWLSDSADRGFIVSVATVTSIRYCADQGFRYDIKENEDCYIVKESRLFNTQREAMSKGMQEYEKQLELEEKIRQKKK